MSIFRTYANALNQEVLEKLTDGLARKGVYANEAYLGQLSEDLRVKAELRYENWDVKPAVGIDIFIINTKCGCVDSYQFNFGMVWGGTSDCHDYWICQKCGWYKREPSSIQMLELAQEIERIVSMYREEYY